MPQKMPTQDPLQAAPWGRSQELLERAVVGRDDEEVCVGSRGLSFPRRSICRQPLGIGLIVAHFARL